MVSVAVVVAVAGREVVDSEVGDREVEQIRCVGSAELGLQLMGSPLAVAIREGLGVEQIIVSSHQYVYSLLPSLADGSLAKQPSSHSIASSSRLLPSPLLSPPSSLPRCSMTPELVPSGYQITGPPGIVSLRRTRHSSVTHLSGFSGRLDPARRTSLLSSLRIPPGTIPTGPRPTTSRSLGTDPPIPSRTRLYPRVCSQRVPGGQERILERGFDRQERGEGFPALLGYCQLGSLTLSLFLRDGRGLTAN